MRTGALERRSVEESAFPGPMLKSYRSSVWHSSVCSGMTTLSSLSFAAELARRMGISKQAVNQLVTELAGFGVIERVADPSDGRASLVRFTPKGKRSLFDGLAVLREIEGELRQQLGEARMDALHDALTRLNDALTP